ncbi:MAG: nucleotidyltransferase domain-containing protein [Atribacterota bacterium]
MLEKLKKALETIAAEIQFDEAYVFGSITKPGRFGNESDIDVEFSGLRHEDFFRMMSFLSMELGWEVTIIQLEGRRLAEKVKTEGIRWEKKICHPEIGTRFPVELNFENLRSNCRKAKKKKVFVAWRALLINFIIFTVLMKTFSKL